MSNPRCVCTRLRYLICLSRPFLGNARLVIGCSEGTNGFGVTRCSVIRTDLSINASFESNGAILLTVAMVGAITAARRSIFQQQKLLKLP